jgi:hypothetical protein
MPRKGEIVMFQAIWTAALAATLVPSADPPPTEIDGSQPKLLVKEKDYFLHALPPGNENWHTRGVKTPGFGFRQSAARGLVVLHTSTATGEMKILAAGGLSVGPDFRNSAPPVYLSYIAGVAADKERLFVLVWSSSDFHAGTSSGEYHLLVFRPGDGKRIRSLELEKPDAEVRQPKETADKGPLRLLDDGVSCFGTKYVFNGTDFVKQIPEKKP